MRSALLQIGSHKVDFVDAMGRPITIEQGMAPVTDTAPPEDFCKQLTLAGVDLILA
jgi:hypothetical protein